METIVASASNALAALPEINLSWSITAAIAVSAIFSQIVVAVLNNCHAYKMKKLELQHVEKMHQMSLSHETVQKQFDVYYEDKKKAFGELLLNAGSFSTHKQNLEVYAALHAASDKALLFCSSDNKPLISTFLKRVDDEFWGSACMESERKRYTSAVLELAAALNSELDSTKPPV